MGRTSTIWGIALTSVGVVFLIVMALLWGLGVWGPGTDSLGAFDDEVDGPADRHFLEQMIPHHGDAVAMAELALTRAEHPELRQLAETIIRDQTREIEQMRAWYRSWYGTDAPAADGDFRGRGGGMGMMGGMMDEADLDALEASPVFDREFIGQMVPHHQMGVMMARMVLIRTDRPELEELARTIMTTQSAEIEQMRDWYQDWYER